MTDAAALRRLAAAALIASAVVPPALIQHGPPLCTFRALTGRPCPSCGLTRSWTAMGHGRFAEASGHHLMGPVTYLAAVALVLGGDRGAARVLEPRGRLRPALALFGAAWTGAWLWRIVRGDHG
jgi:hypothetical protein